MNGIGGGQHGVVSTVLRASSFRTFHVLGMRHMMRMCTPSVSVKIPGVAVKGEGVFC